MGSPVHQHNHPAGWRKYLFSVLIGLAAFGSGILLDVALGVENRGILYSDIFTGVVAAFLTLMLARYYERLRVADSEGLRVAADVNHHVRNALTTVLYSVHVRRDPELIQVTEDAVDRIDWTLREILNQGSRATSRLATAALKRTALRQVSVFQFVTSFCQRVELAPDQAVDRNHHCCHYDC